MKYFASWFLLSILFYSTPLFSQNEKIYTVQVGTFLDARAVDFEPIRPLGMVYAQQLDNNLYRVFLGGFDEEQSARQMAQQLRSRGYNSASVVEIPVEEGRTVTVIQFETLNAKKKINWQDFTGFEQLFAIIRQDVVKLVTGPYPNLDAARRELAAVKQKGYGDAFIKRVNTAFLQEITTFETGIKQPLIPLGLQDAPTAANTRNIPQAYETTPRSGAPADRADPYPSVADTDAANYNKPDIRTNVKRRSVLELQRILQAENAYRGQLDGLYGKGTENAYQQVQNSNRDLQKYRILAQSMTLPVPVGATDQLQAAVNDLLANPQAQTILRQSNHPIAKAYQAYWLFTRRGAGSEVNTLMNNAIHQAYSGRQLEGEAPFDYNATYAYHDLDQLLLHLYYIHMAPNMAYAAPCWLIQQHPKQASQAMSKAMNSSNRQLQLQSCDPFLNWEEARIVLSIAIDLNGSPQINPAPLQQAASERARLFLSSQPLNDAERAAVEKWNAELLANLNGWSTLDPLNKRLALAFKIAYLQTQVRLEDYFMDKGLALEASKGLALATLKTLVGPHLGRFV